ncbi:MAG: FecR domain-containing protein [Novosphingobium sp.]
MTEKSSVRARASHFSAIAAIPVLASGALAAAGPQAVGIASAVLNDVRIESVGARQFRPAMLRQRMALADQVQTGLRSQLQVLLLDKSVFTVGANARLSIDRYVYDPATGRSFSATVAKGAFRFMSGRPDRGHNSSISTPISSIGIRGTIVEGVVGAEAVDIANGERGIGQNRNSDPLTASLIVLRGPGQRTQGNAIPGVIDVTAGGKTVTLDRPMLAVYVPRPGAEPIGPFTLSNSGLARIQALIFPLLAEWAAMAPVGNTPYPVAQPNRPRPPRPGEPFPPDGDAGGSSYQPPYGSILPGYLQFPRPTGLPRPPASTPQTAVDAGVTPQPGPAEVATPQSAPSSQTPALQSPTQTTAAPTPATTSAPTPAPKLRQNAGSLPGSSQPAGSTPATNKQTGAPAGNSLPIPGKP